jgi:hypothetical protein
LTRKRSKLCVSPPSATNPLQKDTMQDRQLQVQIDKWASPEEVQAVEEAFRRAGLEANVRAGIIELSEQFTWIVIISAPAFYVPNRVLRSRWCRRLERLQAAVTSTKTARPGSEGRSGRRSGRKDRAGGRGTSVATAVKRSAGRGVQPARNY